ncbi:unnamed protein product [Rhodiola kirilowii]
METQQQHHLMMADEHVGGKLAAGFTRQTNNNNNNNVASNNGSSSNSSTRWTPTTDQIRILKDLYYNNGIRSPNGDQIQRISARLRQYGKIEGKNVFYWFQNHKARERQKKRFNTTNNNNNTGLVHVPPAPVWKPSSDSAAPYVHSAAVSKYPSNNQHLIYPAGDLISQFLSLNGSFYVLAVIQFLFFVVAGHNQITGEFGYGSITMEKSFRDCSISAGGSSMGNNFGWAAGGMDHHLYPYTSPYAIYEQRKSINSDEYHELLASAADQEYGETRGAEIETLPLFPMRTEDSNYGFCHVSSTETHDGWFHRDVGGSRASLELSLNSYTGMDRF